jgi:hypothetical protein
MLMVLPARIAGTSLAQATKEHATRAKAKKSRAFLDNLPIPGSRNDPKTGIKTAKFNNVSLCMIKRNGLL